MLFDDLKGKNILVTGSTRGIGLAAVQLFVELGANVAMQGRAPEQEVAMKLEELRKHGVQNDMKVRYYAADLCSAKAAEKMVDDFVRDFGSIDVLVNNCGGLGGRAPLGEMNEELYDAVLDLNVRSMVFASNAAVRHMKASGAGSVVSVGSNAGRVGGGPGAALYGGTKAFVVGVQRTWVKELSAANIRFNVVSPGYIETDFHADKSTEVKTGIIKQIPLQRAGTPEDVAKSIAFFASDASAYITGAILDVTGGLTFAA